MYIGELIKDFRDKHNLSMQDFANISGISKAYIGLLEKVYNPTTKEPIAPSLPKVKAIAKAMGMELDDLLRQLDGNQPVVVNTSAKKVDASIKAVKIPVVGRVVAGIPIDAIQEIIDYEEISSELAKTGDFFALRITGHSMEPRMCEGDVVIVKKQESVESGDTAIILVNGNDATIKRIKILDNGILLIANNNSVYEPHFYSKKDIQELPVQILGKVVELRGKF